MASGPVRLFGTDLRPVAAHAAVVDLFVANGFSEARQNHEVPKD